MNFFSSDTQRRRPYASAVCNRNPAADTVHGVTLGVTGKDHGGDTLGANVLIGASASLLGNIHISYVAKIGAGSVVLSRMPPGATAVGSPAKIIA